MYLSRAPINPRRIGANRYLGSPQRIHASVMAAFPRSPASDAALGPRVLWRLDSDDSRRPVLWMVSPEKPDLHHIVDPYGWPHADRPFETKAYTPLLKRLVAGQTYVFRATVNPTMAAAPINGARGKILPLVGPLNQVEWLADRAAGWGFELLPSSAQPPETDGERLATAYSVEIRDSKKLRFWRSGRKTPERRTQPVTLLATTFDGVLRVTNPEIFRRSLTHGVGRGKGYGCGLITLAPGRKS